MTRSTWPATAGPSVAVSELVEQELEITLLAGSVAIEVIAPLESILSSRKRSVLQS